MEKKDLMGCGETCDCPRMKAKYHHTRNIENYYNLWINDKINLEQIDSLSWKYINIYASIYQGRIREKEKMKKEINEILGRNK